MAYHVDYHLGLVVRKPVFGVSWSDTNRAVQPQKMSGGLQFRIKEVEELYYPCSENKGAIEADLRLCFRIMQKGGNLTTRLT